MRHLRAYQSVRLQCGIGKPHLPQSTVDQTEADDAEDTKSSQWNTAVLQTLYITSAGPSQLWTGSTPVYIQNSVSGV